MLRKLRSSIPLRGIVVALFIAHLVYLVISPQHKCSDFSFDLIHPNRTVTVVPLNPEGRYSDLVTFSYHQSLDKLALNNANCQLQITKVDGMARSQLQLLKPYVIKAVLQHARSAHVAYIDWDANFIRRPWNPPADIVVQSTPTGNGTNTGLLLFLDKDKHVKTIDEWIEQERPTSHDQWTWALMERATNVSLWRTADGEFGENYNWNVRDKRRTTARCSRVIFHLTWFRAALNLGIVLILILKLHDFWSMQTKQQCPKRVYLSLILITAILLSVFFKERYHSVQGFRPRYFGERICAIPEITLYEDGSVVTRLETTTPPNAFLACLIGLFGLDGMASLMSFWFTFLAWMRMFARVALAIELGSVASLVCVRRSERAESVVWCALMLWREFRGGRGSAFWKDGVLFAGGGNPNEGLTDAGVMESEHGRKARS